MAGLNKLTGLCCNLGKRTWTEILLDGGEVIACRLTPIGLREGPVLQGLPSSVHIDSSNDGLRRVFALRIDAVAQGFQRDGPFHPKGVCPLDLQEHKMH